MAATINLVYASEDREYAELLQHSLKPFGVEIVDGNMIKIGESVVKELVSSLNKASHIIYIVTPNFISSLLQPLSNVNMQAIYTNIALAENKIIIPVVFQKCELPAWISSREYVDYSTADIGLATTKLLNALYQDMGVAQLSSTLHSQEKPHTSLRITDIPVMPEFSVHGFVGRQKEIAELNRWLNSDVAVAYIIGAFGFGKTWLAWKWLADLPSSIQRLYLDINDISHNSDNMSPHSVALTFISYLKRLLKIDKEASIEDTSRMLADLPILLVIDSIELVIYEVDEVLKLSNPLSELLSGFSSSSPGKILILSQVLPKEFKRRNQGLVGATLAIVKGDLLPGLSEDDYYAAKNSWIPHESGFPDKELWDKARKYLDGQPFALQMFVSISPYDRNRMISDPQTGIHRRLMGDLVDSLMKRDLEILEVMAYLLEPQTASFVEEVATYLNFDNEVSDIIGILDLLHHKSILIKSNSSVDLHYMLPTLVRNVVKTREQVSSQSINFAIARVYERRAEYASQSRNADDYINLSRHASLHFDQAGENHKARQWFLHFLEASSNLGKDAYFNSEYERALSITQDIIDQIRSRNSADEKEAKFLSQAYLHRAISLIRMNYDWLQALNCLQSSVQAMPSIQAIDFAVEVITQSIEQLSSDDEETKLLDVSQYFFRIANKLVWEVEEDHFTDWNQICLRLLFVIGNLDPSQHNLRLIERELAARISAKIDVLSTNTIEIMAKLTVFIHSFATQIGHSIVHIVNGMLEIFVTYTTNAATTYKTKYLGSQLILIRSYYSEESYSKLLRLQLAVKLLLQAIQSYGLTKTNSRLLVQLYTRMAHIYVQDDLQKAISVLSQCEHDLKKLQQSSLSRISETVHLLRIGYIRLRQFKLSSSNKISDISYLTGIAKTLLKSPDELDEDVCELVVEILEANAEFTFDEQLRKSALRLYEDGNNDYEPMESKSKHMTLSKTDIDSFQSFYLPFVNFQPLLPRLWFMTMQLRVFSVYLSWNWQRNSNSVPKAMTMARDIALNGRRSQINHPHLFKTCLDFWGIVARRTVEEALFKESIDEIRILNKLLASESSAEFVFSRALAFRSALLYQEARDVIRTYLTNENSPGRRLSICFLWIDLVSHSIIGHEATITEDRELYDDAASAYELYQDFLDSIGKPQEAWEAETKKGNMDPGIRHMQWLRCGVYAKKIKLEPPLWVKRVYQQVQVDINVSRYTDPTLRVLEELKDDPHPIARIIGADVLNPVRWREAGTWLLSIYGEQRDGLDISTKIWEIAVWLDTMGHSRDFSNTKTSYGSRGTEPSIATLNKIRALLEYPKNSENWRRGKNELSKYISKDNIPYRYYQFYVALWNTL